MVPEPIHFRYAWGRNPLGNLQATGNKDLPFATQRSDDWKMEEVPLGVLGDEVDATDLPRPAQPDHQGPPRTGSTASFERS